MGGISSVLQQTESPRVLPESYAAVKTKSRLWRSGFKLTFYFCAICLALRLFAAVAVELDDIPSRIFPVLAVVAVCWFVVLRGTVSPNLLSFLLGWSLFEWFYKYGATGPALLVLLGLVLFSAGSRLFVQSLKSRLLLIAGIWSCVLVAVRFFSAIAAHDALAIPAAKASWITEPGLFFAVLVCAAVLSKKASMWNGSRLFWSLVFFGVLGFLSLQVQFAEYFYYFYGAPRHIVHPSFAGGILLLGLSAVLLSLKLRAKLVALMGGAILAALFYVYLGQYSLALQLNPLSLGPLQRSGALYLLQGIPFSFDSPPWSVCKLDTPTEMCTASGVVNVVAGLGAPLALLLLILGGVAALKSLKNCSGVTAGFAFLIVAIALFAPGATSPLVFFALAVSLFAADHRHEAEPVLLHPACGAKRGRRRVSAAILLCGVIGVGVFLGSLLTRVQRTAVHEHRAFSVTPDLIKQLVIAEDLLFFSHHGLDFARLKWVVRDTIKSAEFSRGASTLSMQLAKIRYLTYERSLTRKGSQIFLALILETVNSKENLLYSYLNEVSFGSGIIGIRSAAEKYFAKTPAELTSDEALKLVLTIEDPARYNPSISEMPDAVAKRSRLVMERLLRHGHKFDDSVSKLSFVVS